MRKKTKSTIITGLVCAMLSGVLSGCGKEAEPVVNQKVEVTETLEAISSDDVGDKTDEDESTYEEETSDTFEGAEDDNIILYSTDLLQYINKIYEGLEEFEFEKNEVTIVTQKDIILYNGKGDEVGCVKKGGTVNIVESSPNSIWARFVNPLPEAGYDYLYLGKSCMNGAGKSTTTPTTKETSKTETPKTNVPVEESTSKPKQAEEPVVEENEKYTPEEAIAVWKAILDDNGMIYDPSIKEFASWGTGIMYLGKGYPEQGAQDDLEGMAYGDGTGTSYKHYYFEVTGSDENYVYTKAWVCE